MMMETVSFLTGKDKRLAGILHLSSTKSKTGMIILHGLLASKDQSWMKELGERLSKEQNVAVMRFDFLGNGESDGTLQEHTYEQALEDTRAAIKFMRERGFTRIFLLGHSLGGAIALITASNQEIAGVIGLAAVSNPPFIAKRITKRQQETIVVEIGNGSVALPKPFVESAQRFPMEKYISKVSCSVCLVHGTADTVLFPKDSEFLLKALTEVKDKELHLVKDANHVFSSHWHEVFDIVLEWIAKHA